MRKVQIFTWFSPWMGILWVFLMYHEHVIRSFRFVIGGR